MNTDAHAEGEDSELDAEGLLAQRQKIEKMFKDKFVRTVTLMFTDLKGSTSITEEQGDLATRELLKTHNDMLFPIISKHDGNLVKTMGDGTMSYFEDAQKSVETAMEFQRAVLHYNKVNNPKVPIQVRIGINTGDGIVEKDDVYGDVVNVASRFESIADAGEIYFSKSTYDALIDPHAFYCRMIKTTSLKGKKEPVQVYKAFWEDAQIKEDQEFVQTQKSSKGTNIHSTSSMMRIAIWLSILSAIVFGIMTATDFMEGTNSGEKSRSTSHTIE